VTEIPENEICQYYLGDLEVLVIKIAGRYYGLAGRCTHAGAPLVEGRLDGEILTCPWHGSQFRVTDGSVIRGPADEPLKSYSLLVQDGFIFTQL
jgi:nitrite reductase/ring-hydroxylating ferredoxin subunit